MPGIIENIFTSGKLLRGAKDIIDEIVTTKEEKIQLELRMRELFRQHEHDTYDRLERRPPIRQRS